MQKNRNLMSNIVKFIILSVSVLFLLALMFLPVNNYAGIGLTVLLVSFCWYIFRGDIVPENRETSRPVAHVAPATGRKVGKGTKDLCLQLLKELNVEVEKDDENEDTYNFEYFGERLSVRTSNDDSFIMLYDTFWKRFPAEDLEMVTLARKTVNRANIVYNGFTLIYSFVDNTMWIHSNTSALLVPEIAYVEEYFKSVLKRFLFAHKAFDEAMFEQMKEDGAKS